MSRAVLLFSAASFVALGISTLASAQWTETYGPLQGNDTGNYNYLGESVAISGFIPPATASS